MSSKNSSSERKKVANITPNNNNGNERYTKCGQDQRPAKTSLPEQETGGEEACLELDSNVPTMEQIMDNMVRSLQEE